MSDKITQTQGLCEDCLPDAICWATSTPEVGPKSYFVVIKDGDEQIAVELKYNKADKKVTVEPYTPGNYDYTIHDFCNHDIDECILYDPAFLEQEAIDRAAQKAGVKGALDIPYSI